MCDGRVPEGLQEIAAAVQAFVVDSHAHIEHVEHEEDIARVKLSHKTQTLIVEAVDELPDHPVYGFPSKLCSEEMPNYGMMRKSWVKIKMPTVINTSDEYDEYPMHDGPLYIIHSIVPYKSRKCTRDSDA